MKSVTVVGTGIIGLSTAIALQEKGFQVRMMAKEKFDLTLSSKVGAIWFPFAIEPQVKADAWAGKAYERYMKEAGFAPGITLVPFLNASLSDENETWTKQIPEGKVRKAHPSELLPGMTSGYIADVPLAEPPLYLPYLFEKFLKSGGTFAQKTFSTLSEMAGLDEYVVNCTGLGAKAICQDEELYPIRGQILRAEKFNLICFADPTKKGALSYIINRSEDCVIGGTDYENDWNESVDPSDTDKILGRLKGFGIQETPKVLEIIVGLRPKRSSVRFEFDSAYPNIFHNYGHGGAGFTVCWGCALEIADLLKLE